MNIEVAKIRSTIYQAINDFFRDRGFYHVSPPVLTSFSCEVACVGGSDLISVNYYNQKAFLSQSAQLYLESMALQLGQVYCLNPAFRAESTLLSTHLSEFWMCEMEMINITLDELIQNIEELMLYIVKIVLEKNRVELNMLNANLPNLESLLVQHIPQITYFDAIKLLKKEHVSIDFGDDIQELHHQILCNLFDDRPLIITLFPQTLSSFYKQSSGDVLDTVQSVDVIAPNGYGELLGGSIRKTDVCELKKSLAHSVSNLEPYQWYFDTIASHPIPHGGYGLGIERLISWICGLESIKEAIPFPRTEDLLCP